MSAAKHYTRHGTFLKKDFSSFLKSRRRPTFLHEKCGYYKLCRRVCHSQGCENINLCQTSILSWYLHLYVRIKSRASVCKKQQSSAGVSHNIFNTEASIIIICAPKFYFELPKSDFRSLLFQNYRSTAYTAFEKILLSRPCVASAAATRKINMNGEFSLHFFHRNYISLS